MEYVGQVNYIQVPERFMIYSSMQHSLSGGSRQVLHPVPSISTAQKNFSLMQLYRYYHQMQQMLPHV